MAKLNRDDIYVGMSPNGDGRNIEPRVWVLGAQFGPMLLCVDCDCSEAYDEWLERHCEELQPKDSALQDFDGADDDARIAAALDSGELRATDGGSFRWSDPYEWQRGFRTVREAGAFFRSN